MKRKINDFCDSMPFNERTLAYCVSAVTHVIFFGQLHFIRKFTSLTSCLVPSPVFAPVGSELDFSNKHRHIRIISLTFIKVQFLISS